MPNNLWCLQDCGEMKSQLEHANVLWKPYREGFIKDLETVLFLPHCIELGNDVARRSTHSEYSHG